MSPPTPFARIDAVPPELQVTITVDGAPVVAARGESLLAALLAQGLLALRQTERTGRPRGAFCGMGVCMDCVVHVRGRGMVRACAEPVHDGLICHTGLGEEAP